MKTSFAKVAGGLALLAVSSVAMASVVNTKHNLGNGNSVGSNHTAATTEICIFCHTPHGGDQTTFAPIWNRATGTAVYTRFSSLGRLTFDAAEAPVGAVSAACLSCHDGTQSMDSVINSSGSDTIGMEDTGTGNGGNGLWSQGRRMGNGSFQGANGAWTGTLLPRGDMVYIGTDLSNDHPISMQYGGGGITTAATAGPTIDPDFAQATGQGLVPAATTGGFGGGANPSHAGTNNTTGGVAGSGTGTVQYTNTLGGPRWYVDTGTAGYQGTDFPLYTRTFSANASQSGSNTLGFNSVGPAVECGTCHDPHSGNSTFLRAPGGNANSQVCLTCHAK